MEKKRSSIVPGRRMLSEQMALHQFGMADDNKSYLMEKTCDESTFMDCSQDREVRKWRKDGFSETQIFRIQEERTLKKHTEAEARLEREKCGAKTFEELLALQEHARRNQTMDTDEELDADPQGSVFAVPALPKHIKAKSTEMSPAGKAKGKPGFGCSTPVKGKNASMRSLETLDISLVVKPDALHPKNVNIQEKNIRVSLKRSTPHFHRIDDESERVEKDDTLQGTFTVAKDSASDSSLQKTHTIHKPDEDPERTFTVQKDDSLQGTFTVAKDSVNDSSLQKTHTIHKENDEPGGTFTVAKDASLQGTFTVAESSSQSLIKTFVRPPWDDEGLSAPSSQPAVVEDSAEDRSASLQGAFVKETDEAEATGKADQLQNTLDVFESNERTIVIEDVHLAQNTVEGGPSRRKSNKMDLEEREKRTADMTSSLLNSMVDDAPSPGQMFFKNANRKKIRPTTATPPRNKYVGRLSTDSDKEKTIEMLSIAEDPSMESNGSSFVEPVSVNGSRFSPVPEEHDGGQSMDLSVTPKSTRRSTVPLRQQSVEKDRAIGVSFQVSMCQSAVGSPCATPLRNYEKPTFSSLGKNKNATMFETEKAKQLEKMNKKTSIDHTPTRASTALTLAGSNEEEDVVVAPVSIPNPNRSPSSPLAEEHDEDTPTVFPVASNTSIGNVEADMNALAMNDNNDYGVNYDMDFDDDYRQDHRDVEEEDEQSPAPVQRPKPRSRRGVALLSDSMVSVNTPGIAGRRTTRRAMNDSAVDYNSNSDEEEDEGTSRNSRRNGNKKGLQLAKRKIIKPQANDDGLRRSTRTRVKPVRSWLGEQAVYVNSPSGGKRLKGVTDVFITDKRLCKYRTADLGIATEREQRERARKRARAEERRRQLAHDQSMGRRLNESQEDINTSDEEQ